MLNKKNSLITAILIGVILSITSLSLKFFLNPGHIILKAAPVICSLGFALIGGGLGGLYQVILMEKNI